MSMFIFNHILNSAGSQWRLQRGGLLDAPRCLSQQYWPGNLEHAARFECPLKQCVRKGIAVVLPASHHNMHSSFCIFKTRRLGRFVRSHAYGKNKAGKSERYGPLN